MTNIERARSWLTGVGSLTKFDDRTSALAAMLDDAERRSREEERVKIAAWLRDDYKYNANVQPFADAIEAGEQDHPKGPPPVGLGRR